MAIEAISTPVLHWVPSSPNLEKEKVSIGPKANMPLRYLNCPSLTLGWTTPVPSCPLTSALVRSITPWGTGYGSLNIPSGLDDTT